MQPFPERLFEIGMIAAGLIGLLILIAPTFGLRPKATGDGWRFPVKPTCLLLYYLALAAGMGVVAFCAAQLLASATSNWLAWAGFAFGFFLVPLVLADWPEPLILDGQGLLDKEILKGMLLPFGGYKGSAIALMVELLSAGAVGERFSFEAAEADNKDGGPPRGGEFMLAISPELLAGPGWAEHCEKFFSRFATIEGARLPGSRRHNNRLSTAPRNIDVALLERIRALCN